MSGPIPTIDELSRLYYELGKAGARSAGAKKKWTQKPKDLESLFLLSAEWSRFDPRLLEILVDYALNHWEGLRPQKLREKMRTMETPQTVGVLASFIETISGPAQEVSLFWRYVTEGLKPVPFQYYFRDLYSPGDLLSRRAVLESLTEFKAWGFLARERIVIDPSTKKAAGTWDQEARLNILKRLFTKERALQISDYLQEIDHGVSRQQALLDLKALGAQQKEKGRVAYWVTPPSNSHNRR